MKSLAFIYFGLSFFNLFGQQKFDRIECQPIEIKIDLVKSEVLHFEDIQITVQVKNVSDSTIKILFDSPSTSLWGMNVSIVNQETGEDIVKYSNKEILSSRIYSNTELKEHYYSVLPNQILKKTVLLADLTILKDQQNNLPKGEYRVNISRFSQSCIIHSNQANFRIK